MTGEKMEFEVPFDGEWTVTPPGVSLKMKKGEKLVITVEKNEESSDAP
jgi:hypothetical protein